MVLAALMLGPGHVSAESGARLAGPEIIRLISERRIVVRTDRAVRGSAERPQFYARADGIVTEVSYVFRGDLSYRRQCKRVVRGNDTVICRGAFGGVGIGVWEVRDGFLCTRDLVAGTGREACHSIARVGTKYRFHAAPDLPMRGSFRSFLDGLEFDAPSAAE